MVFPEAPPEVRRTALPDAAARSQWWRCLFEASEDAQLVCRADGAVLEVNPKALRLLGLNDVPQLSFCSLGAFLTPGTARKLTDILGACTERQATLPAVTLLCRGQLSLIADLQVTPLGDGCSLVTVKDASRRWRMESHIQRLITAVNSTTDVVFLTDTDFRITFANAAFQLVTGHSIEDALGRTADFLRAPSETGRVEAYQQAIAEGEDWRGELVNVRADSSTYPVEAAISPIYDRNGSLLGYVAFERDISAQKKLQRDLQLERDYAQSIVDSVDAAIFSVDRELRLRHANRSWQRLAPGFGWLQFQSTPHPGQSLLDYIPDPARRTEVRRTLEQVLLEGRPQEFRGTAAGGQQWVVKVTPWKHDQEVLGLNYVVVDQTRFCELQAQLFQAQKMETVGALAAGVAHDFNNLLLAIRGNVALLQMAGELTEDQRNRLGLIDKAASRAADITHQLLTFSRSSEAKDVVLDFNLVVKEACQLARRSLRNKIELRLELPDTPVKVRIDATRANQMLLNLAVNAQDAMPDGGRLTIANRVVSLTPTQLQRLRAPSSTEFLCCAVADNGSGIPPEILGRIFDPFFTTKDKGKGTGLGLAIVHNVVASAGGFIEVESALGQGTRFLIYLPLVEAVLTKEAASAAPSLVRGAGRILVVDDLDFIVDFTQSFLKAAGYEVLTAFSADEALSALQGETQPVDLLLTDFSMPGGSGVDLIRQVKRRWPAMKLVLASGYLEEAELEVVQNELGAQILHKPYNVREATDVVNRLLRGVPAASAGKTDGS